MIKLYSEEFLKLLVEEQKEPVTEMLKDDLPLSKILKYSRIDKESIYEIAKDNNLSVADDTVPTSGYSKEFQELIDKEVEKTRKKFKKKSIKRMLKDNLPLSKILRCSGLDKESIYQIAKDINLSVIDDTVSTSGYSKEFQELIDKEIEKKRKKLKKKSIITMLKKKYPLNDIIECLFVKKKYVLKTAKENNLPVNDKNKGKQKV